jgi:hypothetical protein
MWADVLVVTVWIVAVSLISYRAGRRRSRAVIEYYEDLDDGYSAAAIYEAIVNVGSGYEANEMACLVVSLLRDGDMVSP